MAIQIALKHETHYRYDRAIRLGPQVIRLRPAPHCATPVHAYSLRVSPARHFLNWQQDPQGNHLARVVFPEPTRELSVVVDLVAELAVRNPFDFFLEESAEVWPFAYEPALRHELDPYLELEPDQPGLDAWLGGVPRESRATVQFLVDLNQRVHGAAAYVIRLEPGVQAPDETLEKGRGSCRDSAWLLVQALRRLGVAARFASGYLVQLVPDVPSLDGPSGPERDFTDLHAWAEAYVPGAGWVGLDPTSGLLAGEGHIPLACSPSPGSAAPISGSVERCEVDFRHAMSVERICEEPRVTLPYPEGSWEAIVALGRAVDARLEAGDVRLTMGGEPTFVSIDDVDAEEWNTDAMGPTKRALADDLVRRLRARFAPHGVLHHGQGKWYPGEPLPRWAFGLYWRSDGVPLWRDAARIAEEHGHPPPPAEASELLLRGIARRLEVDPELVQPVFEDPLVVVAQEAVLSPASHEALADPEDARARARLARALERGVERPAGFVLPVQVWNARDGRRFRSERWETPRGRLYLLPGDSPLGFRLPLRSLAALSPLDYPHVFAADPTLPRPPLARPAPRRQPFLSGTPLPQTGSVPAGPGGPVRTALATEVRDGHLCIFLPPLETADDWVELVAAVEDAAAEQALPVRLEGYPPPPDARLRSLHVTPDPGVIEVNTPPSRSFDELTELTVALYEEARLARLGTEKFLLDGRHVGTGGGNHVVVGGATPADSPFLRRPDLLRSLLGFWLDHPSLSYLFSGLFIGPTSQAPRVDEARHEALYELEIAFARVPEPGQGDCPPWLVDRLFRNLLVDVTGNTHRAEFCIDKLYSPDSATGRLGLLELRSFEMPPHPRMSLAQQLLLRALIARFWELPRHAPLRRLGTALHDRYLLPHYVWEDLREVLAELREAGFAFEDSWYAPHREFRFPVLGRVACRGVEIELRQALEPWHVLGEEGVPGGTARYVDSSVERLQVRVSGDPGGRYRVACNRQPLPLRATGVAGESVAGVRFRAWQPARCLHPTIPVQAPLVVDLYDTFSGRAVGGCTYHVAHPGGRSYERFPVNAHEAEGRRLGRFQPFGHTPGPYRLPEPMPQPEFPTTLDLRRAPAVAGGDRV